MNAKKILKEMISNAPKRLTIIDFDFRGYDKVFGIKDEEKSKQQLFQLIKEINEAEKAELKKQIL
jgi:hypothetical protein